MMKVSTDRVIVLLLIGSCAAMETDMEVQAQMNTEMDYSEGNPVFMETTVTTTVAVRYDAQPSTNVTCVPGVCGKGRWAAYFGAQTEAECKAKCDSGRRLVPEPDGIEEKVYSFRQNGQFQNLLGGKLVPDHKRTVTEINYRSTGGYWSGWKARDHFYAHWEGKIKITKAGKYKFWTRSDDGSRLTVNSREIVNNGGWHGMRWKEGSIDLTAGSFNFWAEMFEGGGGAGMELYYQGEDTNNQRIKMPAAAFDGGIEEKGFFFHQNGRFHNVDAVIPAKAVRFERKVDHIMYSSTGGYWDAEFQKRHLRDNFYVRWSGYINIKAAGEYRFWIVSDDGSRLSVDDKSMVQNPRAGSKEGRRQLSAGKHSFWAEMFEGGGNAGMQFYYQGADTGNKRVPVPKEALSSSLEGSGKLMLPDTAMKGMCDAYSHEGSHCFLYTDCKAVDAAATEICEDNTVDWVGALASFKTCTYVPNPPAKAPTAAPTVAPTVAPTAAPTVAPTQAPAGR